MKLQKVIVNWQLNEWFNKTIHTFWLTLRLLIHNGFFIAALNDSCCNTCSFISMKVRGCIAVTCNSCFGLLHFFTILTASAELVSSTSPYRYASTNQHVVQVSIGILSRSAVAPFFFLRSGCADLHCRSGDVAFLFAEPDFPTLWWCQQHNNYVRSVWLTSIFKGLGFCIAWAFTALWVLIVSAYESTYDLQVQSTPAKPVFMPLLMQVAQPSLCIHLFPTSISGSLEQ